MVWPLFMMAMQMSLSFPTS